MPLDQTGIIVEREFYSEHYIKSILEQDLSSTFARWAADEQASPLKAVCRAADGWDAMRQELNEHPDAAGRAECQRGWLLPLLAALGYEWRPEDQAAEDGATIPVVGEIAKHDGRPELWLLEAVDLTGELADPLTLPVRPGDDSEDAVTWDDLITRHVFTGEEPPRWVLLFHAGQLLLIERAKWPERRMLRFTFEKLVTSREALKLFTALVARDSICPRDGNNLHDRLDEGSHKHAYEVSKDLKVAAREAIELLGNEALWHRRQISKKAVYDGAESITPEDLSRECLRYLYRLLFLFFVEARPALGYAPMDSEEYRDGYSLESLRELAIVPLDTEEGRGGYFLDESIRKLFHMVFHGFSRPKQMVMAAMAGDSVSRASQVHTFEMKPLDGDLFDESRTPILRGVRFRNHVWQRVLELLGYSKKGGALGRGRISYAQLGINQLGAVYEGLLSYTGFFAKADLYEVKKKDVKEVDPLEQAWFVTREELDQYEEAEKVFEKDGRAKVYPQGTFIYRLNGRNRQKSASYYTPEVLTQCVVKYALKELLDGRTADEILNLNVCEPALGSGAFLNEAINQLSREYVTRKARELGRTLTDDERDRLCQPVKAYLADNRVFGVDMNPVAVELAEISLWLNTIYKGHTIPWFGGQLEVGNSLIGARRQVFQKDQLTAKGRPWLEAVPDRGEPATSRPADSVYHFLVPDNGMGRYEDRAVKAMCPDETKVIADWRKGFRREFDSNEAATLIRLSDAVDGLLRRHTEKLRQVRDKTEHTFPIFGHEDWPERGANLTTRERQKIREKDLVGPSSDHARLKFVMDYWCALWFWPIEKANLLPSRDEFLLEVESVLKGTVRATETIRPTQGNMFAPEQPSLSVADRYGLVNVDELCEGPGRERFRLIREIAKKHKFFHWELEFADIFDDHGGFDLMLGNPPWVKVEWNEGAVLGDFDPRYAIRDYSAAVLATERPSALARYPDLRSAYLEEYVELEGTQCSLNARQNYPLLLGSQSNTYKCFVTRSWELATARGFQGFLHPEGVYEDPKGGVLRSQSYTRLRSHFQHQNGLSLFADVAHRERYSVNVYGPSQTVRFIHISNLFHPITIERSLSHAGEGTCYGIKTDDNGWNLDGHLERVFSVDEGTLSVFGRLYDDSETPPLQARLPALHSTGLLRVLEKLADYPHRLADIEYTTSEMWHETNAVKFGTIRPETRFAQKPDELILSGPHVYVSTPFFQTPRRRCIQKSDYDLLLLTELPEAYLPRTNFVPACNSETYRRRVPSVPWNPGVKIFDLYRLIARRRLPTSNEHTLFAALFPPGPAHIDACFSVIPRECSVLVALTAGCCSLLFDFFLRTTGKSDFRDDTARQLPLLNGSRELSVRTVLMNALTVHYADLWRECFDVAFTQDRWAKQDRRLDDRRFTSLTPDWSWHTPLRTDYERRQALIEIDVLVAMELGLTCDELCTIYRIQFPVLYQYERNTYYDRNGRIVYLAGDQAYGLSTPEWKKQCGKDRIERPVEDDTLPTGKRTRTIIYEGPYDKCDREEDYRTVWAEFERRRQQA